MSANQKSGRGRPKPPTTVDEGKAESVMVDLIEEDVSTVPISSSESQLARSRLRERWELASVLNFLHVFQPIIQSGLGISAEEIETALITPNDALAQLHIALLKGIPPVSKNLKSSDAWVTILCKKLAMWWPWVAEGKVPLVADHGAEISRYKELDPTVRLLILKALCEIRAEQDDTLRYIDETLKQGAELSTFRKDRIGRGGNGASYWYDGDSVIGHRLYKETNKIEHKQRLKADSRLTQPTINSQWETLATNLEEFMEISDRLSSSNILVESAVGEIINNEIIPILEKLQKKKERALKRQQRQAMLLEGFRNAVRIENGRSRRDRKPVNYTFDEYDRSIDEAIQMAKKAKTSDDKNDEGGQGEHASGKDGISSNGTLPNVDNSSNHRGGASDDSDGDYDDKNDVDNVGDEDTELGTSDDDNDDHGDQKRSKHTHEQKDRQLIEVLGLRRSKRTAASSDHQKHDAPNVETEVCADTKKGPMPREGLNMNYDVIVSDSEDDKLSESKNADSLIDVNEKVLGTEKESIVAAKWVTN